MARVEPIPGEPAAVVDLGCEHALVLADYHAGIEAGLRYERGVELDSAADERRDRVCTLLDRTAVDRLVVLGDFGHRIGRPTGEERRELTQFLDTVTERVPITLAQGNHDGGLVEAFGERLDVLPTDGGRIGPVGFLHGHTWPSADVLSAETLCTGHEHVAVRLEDRVGGQRVERAWLRGRLRREPFEAPAGAAVVARSWADPDLVVFPAFNDRSGGTWVNVEEQEFLSPFLPDGLADGELFLLDGTRLGAYRSV
ncbi:metallophosphoesterase [Haloferacaceae archaeon DSL9]